MKGIGIDAGSGSISIAVTDGNQLCIRTTDFTKEIYMAV